MPQKLLDKVVESEKKFDQGFKTTEYLAATLLDQAWHQLKPDEIPIDALAFEASALKKAGVDVPTVPPRYRSAYFSHAFAGGYSAGYYAYLWSEVLDADAFAAFEEAGDIFDPATAKGLHDHVYAAGGSRDPEALYTAFRGRLPTPEALLRRRGLADAAAPVT